MIYVLEGIRFHKIAPIVFWFLTIILQKVICVFVSYTAIMIHLQAGIQKTLQTLAYTKTHKFKSQLAQEKHSSMKEIQTN